jgi:SAM-dependent methyltransferase
MEFKARPKYGICRECGCYVNRTPPLPEELKKLYSFDFYWHTLQKFRGHPKIEERTSNDKSDGRVEYWLSLLNTCTPPGKRVLEVGCAHGILLKELSERGFQCTGIEVDPVTAKWTAEKTGLPIHAGVFPGVRVPDCDLFLSFDVLEHAISPEAFLREAARLLPALGVAVIQTPIDFQDLDPPFGNMFEKSFDDAQHLFVFTRKSLRMLAERAGLTFRSEHQWRPGHEIVVLQKPAGEPS